MVGKSPKDKYLRRNGSSINQKVLEAVIALINDKAKNNSDISWDTYSLFVAPPYDVLIDKPLNRFEFSYP